MTGALPFWREAGAGQAVVCLHSNASSSAQWRPLIERLAPACHVFAPDSYGAGKSPPWPGARPITLADEVALLAPVLARAGTPLALVGHSYGAAVALVAALADPGRVREQQISLQQFELLVGNSRLSEQAESRIDAVGDIAAGDDVFHQRARQ